MMTKKEIISELVRQDIEDITQMVYQNDYEFLTNILTGEGFIGYNNLTNKQLEQEYNSRLLPDDATPITIKA